jgi:superfamily II DNA helicase RecQ
LRQRGPKSTGKLHTEVCPNGDMTRDEFEEVLGAMARAGLVQHMDAVFEKDGKQILYRNVKLTREGDRADENTPIRFIMKDAAPASPKQTRRRKARTASEQTATRARPRQKQSIASRDRTPAREVRSSQLEEALRSWRLAEARRRGIPAFRVFTDRALRAMVDRRPATAEQLLAIPGIGMAAVKQYGPHIFRILRGTGL